MTGDGLRIGTTIADSSPAFTPRPRPPAGAPNVVLVVLDDLGFGQLGCFGSDLRTPALNALASQGLRYNRFHVTALCSPTRACLLTGRNHHAVGMGFLTDVPIGFPGYTGRIPTTAATLPRVLRDAGYSTFAVGKWHLTPRWEQSASGPFRLWPLGVGFERYYGFLAGDTNQWTPDLISDNHAVDPPRRPEDGYHLTEDLVDAACRMILDQHQATPDTPFFCYLAPGATHAPHQVPEEWIAREAGRFDDGWEAWRRRTFERQVSTGIVPEGTTLPDRPPWVDRWDDLPVDRHRLFARMMEVYAAFLAHTDAQIGRLVEHLRTLGVLDDTLLVVCSDNGASAEGGPLGSFNEHRFTHDRLDDVDDTIARQDQLGGFRAYNHYPWGWAWAGNTPMRLWKRYTWLGGVRTPLIVHWPARITDGGAVRDQFCHAVDIAPTVLEVAGVRAPAQVDGVDQRPLDGASLAASFDDADAPSPRDTQYFEMLGSRAIYHGGWKATTDHVGGQIGIEMERLEGSRSFDDDRWALFHLDEDFAEAHDLADEHPDRLTELVDRWWAEAERNQVLPLDDSFIGRAVALEPSPHGPRARAVLRPGGGPVAEDLLPPLGGGFELTADVSVPDGGAEGVLGALGDWSNGFALYVHAGQLVLAVNLFGALTRVRSTGVVPPGEHRLGATYRRRPSGGGSLTLHVDGAEVGHGDLSDDLPFRWQIGGGGLVVGSDRGFPVCDDYEPPFAFTGELRTVTVDSLALRRPGTDGRLAAELRHE